MPDKQIKNKYNPKIYANKFKKICPKKTGYLTRQKLDLLQSVFYNKNNSKLPTTQIKIDPNGSKKAATKLARKCTPNI